MAGDPVTIKCPICQQVFPAPAELLGTDGHQVLMRLDRSELYGHMSECEGKVPRAVAEGFDKAELSARVNKFLDERDYLSKAGSRACTMCGTNGVDCMVVLDKKHEACCVACGSGNTHPAPGEIVGSCAQWAAERQAKA